MSFDVNSFLGGSIAEPISDKAPTVPKGRWLCRIAELDGKEVSSWIKPPTGNATSPRLDVPVVILDESVMREMGRTKPPTFTQGYFLNIDSANPARIDSKNNSQFGELLASLRVTGSTNGELFSKLPGAGPFYATFAPDKKDDTRMRIVKTEAA